MAGRGTTIAIPIGVDGLTGLRPGTGQLGIGQLTEMWNVVYKGEGVAKAGGSKKYNTTPLANPVIGGADFWVTPAIQRMVVYTTAGTLLKDDGSGTFATTLKSGLATSGIVPVFLEAGRETSAKTHKLIMFNGVNPPQVLSGDGATTSNIATPPADWTGSYQPKFGLIHEFRHFAFGNGNDPSRVYYTAPGDHEVFTGTGTGSISVFPGSGGELYAGVSFRGILVLFKRPHGVYFLDTRDVDITKWTVSEISRAVGIASPLAFAVVDNDILFFDTSWNVQLLTAIDAFGNVSNRNVADAAQLDVIFERELNLGQSAQIRGIFYPRGRVAMFGVAGLGSTINNRIVGVDFQRVMRPPRFWFADKDEALALWLRLDVQGIARPMASDNSGYIWELDQDTKNKDGQPYAVRFFTAATDLSAAIPGGADRRKMGMLLELVTEPTGTWDIDIDVFWDDELRDTLTFNLGVTGAALDSFVLDTDALSGERVLLAKRRLRGTGYFLAFQGRQTGLNTDFVVSRFLARVKLASAKAYR